jgi:hypothetical protein
LPPERLVSKSAAVKVEDALEMRPFWKPMTVPVALPQLAGVNSNGTGVNPKMDEDAAEVTSPP